MVIKHIWWLFKVFLFRHQCKEVCCHAQQKPRNPEKKATLVPREEVLLDPGWYTYRVVACLIQLLSLSLASSLNSESNLTLELLELFPSFGQMMLLSCSLPVPAFFFNPWKLLPVLLGHTKYTGREAVQTSVMHPINCSYISACHHPSFSLLLASVTFTNTCQTPFSEKQVTLIRLPLRCCLCGSSSFLLYITCRWSF